jgi:hypothetical protein
MINGISTLIGGIVLAGMATIVTNPLLPDPKFLRVVSIEQVGSDVKVDRIISGPNTVADWRVTVVGHGHDAPYCQTIPGRKMHQGWSDYVAGHEAGKTMSLDVWVADTGCYQRLTSGVYTELTTWTPRDGREPVTYRRKFTKE